MKAVVPHKDTLFFLAGIQRNIISLLSKYLLVYPQYPLHACIEGEVPAGITSCIIGCPRAEKETAVFPLEIKHKNGKLCLSIPFARTSDKSKMPDFNLPEEIKNAFPRKERIFKVSTVIQKDNGWKLFDDKWIKISK